MLVSRVVLWKADVFSSFLSVAAGQYRTSPSLRVLSTPRAKDAYGRDFVLLIKGVISTCYTRRYTRVNYTSCVECVDTKARRLVFIGPEEGKLAPPVVRTVRVSSSPLPPVDRVALCLPFGALRCAGASDAPKTQPPPPSTTGGRDRHDDVDGKRVRWAGRNGQRGMPRLHRERHDGRAGPGCHQEDDSPGKARKARGDRGDGQVSCII